MKASLGPGVLPANRPLTPVRARPVRGSSPNADMRCATRAAVFTSLKPVSGLRRIVSPRSMIVSAWRSIASQTARFSSSLLLILYPALSYRSRHRSDTLLEEVERVAPEYPVYWAPAQRAAQRQRRAG